MDGVNYGPEDPAMQAYLAEGEKRAFQLGNRGPAMKARVTLALIFIAASMAPAVAQTSKVGPACGELSKTWEGTAYAASGDSLAGVGLKSAIGLWGIRAAEMPSMPGMRARAALEDMLGSGENKVSCRMIGWDSACRAVAQCTIEELIAVLATPFEERPGLAAYANPPAGVGQGCECQDRAFRGDRATGTQGALASVAGRGTGQALIPSP
jgi:hypothetical protein